MKQAMHMINTGYSVYFNKKNRRAGPLFQGRYKSPLIEADEYLHHVSRYIHLNPVKTATKLAQKPEDYKWSSYKMFTGKEIAPEWLKTEFILGMFGKSKKEAEREYEKFVKDATIDSKKILDDGNIMGILVGGMGLFEEIKKKYIDTRDDDEIPKIREIKRLDDAQKVAIIKEEVSKVFKREAERKKITIYLVRMNTGYSLNEISALVGGLTYSGISQVCRRVEKRRREDKGLDAKINKLNRKVSNVPGPQGAKAGAGKT